MDDLTSEFLVETNDSLEALDNDFITLEQNPDDEAIIGNIFRVMHTIKGTCGFIGLSRLEKLAHAGENIMDKLRDGDFQATPEIISLILEANDQIKVMVDYIEENEVEPDGEDTDLITRLNYCADNGKVGGGSGTDGGGDASVDQGEQENTDSAGSADAPDQQTDLKTPDLDEEIDFTPVMAPDADADNSADAPDQQADLKTPDLDEEIDFTPVMAPDAAPKEAPIVVEDKPTPPPSPKVELNKSKKDDSSVGDKKKASNQSIRVNLGVLENLMQMVGELVLTRNQLLQRASNNAQLSNDFNSSMQNLNHITSELQAGVMQTRMQPVKSVWAKFPRVIRDLSLELKKDIELVMEGEETELDRQMLEAIKDPLTHMVRNSADHGVETPEVRAAAGKTEKGCITLSAYHEGGHIIIKISDNGGGLNVDKIKSKALENGIATAEELEEMSDQQIFQFIFSAGFSTAAEVTAVSGRGVGMDVVVSNIKKAGGHVEVTSEAGKGSEFIVRLPLTLTIMPVLIVTSAQETFAIPQIRVSEIVLAAHEDSQIEDLSDGAANDDEDSSEDNNSNGSKEGLISEVDKASKISQDNENIDENGQSNLESKESENNELSEYFIEKINGAPVMRLRGKLLSLVSLADALKLPRDEDMDAKSDHPVDSFVVVCESGAQSFGILVDRVFNTEEIVVKPMTEMLKHLDIYTGSTILGDGNVVMIIDPTGILKTAGLEERGGGKADEAQNISTNTEMERFLMFSDWQGAPKAVPLELVSRLEEIDATKIEFSSGQRVIQYRDGLMRLVTCDVDDDIPGEGTLEVIVFTDSGRTIGLVVKEIMDIVDSDMDIKSVSDRPGLLGGMVIEDVTTDLIDISHYFSQAFSDWLGHGDSFDLDAPEEDKINKKLLLVDDSAFFRKFMQPILTLNGYDVDTAEDALVALEILADTNNNYDVIITDIDMPNMNGVEFTIKCKQEERLKHIPFIALTSHNETDLGSDIEKLGFSAFVTKSNRDKLVNVISRTLQQLKDDVAA